MKSDKRDNLKTSLRCSGTWRLFSFTIYSLINNENNPQLAIPQNLLKSSLVFTLTAAIIFLLSESFLFVSTLLAKIYVAHCVNLTKHSWSGGVWATKESMGLRVKLWLLKKWICHVSYLLKCVISHICSVCHNHSWKQFFLLKISPFGARLQLPTGPTAFKMTVYIFLQGTVPYFPCFSLPAICILCLAKHLYFIQFVSLFYLLPSYI